VTETFSAACSPGLEPILQRELRGLGLAAREPRLNGGEVEFQGSVRELYRANLLLRTADRVAVKLGAFYANTFPELRKKASRLSWERYLAPGRPVALRAECRRSRLYHKGAVAERLLAAIADNLGKPPRVEEQDEDAGRVPQLVLVRLEANLCTVTIDSSGAPLHRRGYRLAGAKAPLRETLACAAVMASGWDGASPLLDPFCGSGTIPIEAALLARRIAPGAARRFAFMDWAGFDAPLWDALLADARAQAGSAGPRIIASDRDAGAVRAARANAGRAGVAGCIEFSCRALSAIEPPSGPGWLVCNPPYGVRLKGSGDLRNLYAQLGNVLSAKCPGWRAAVLCSDTRLFGSAGLSFELAMSAMNGPLKVRLGTCLV